MRDKQCKKNRIMQSKKEKIISTNNRIIAIYTRTVTRLVIDEYKKSIYDP